MLNENSHVMLKEDFCFFQDGEFVCLYSKSQKLIVLKLKAGENAYSEAVSDDLKRPHKLEWLSQNKYWKWLGTVIKKYPDYFDIYEEGKKETGEFLKKMAKENDYFSVVDRMRFAEKFAVDSSFADTKVYFYGLTDLNIYLFREIADKVSDIRIIKRNFDLIDNNSFIGYEKEQDFVKEYQGIIVDEDKFSFDEVSKDALFMADLTGVSKEDALKMNRKTESLETVTLFYANKRKEAVVGPLVIGKESACLKCLEDEGVYDRYFTGENSFLDSVNVHFFGLFVNRALDYIKGTNLYYLLSDSQIPINKIFTLDKGNLTGSVNYVYKSTKCECTK